MGWLPLDKRPYSVCILTRSLATGGAERQLTLLARGLAAKGHPVTILTFYPGGDLLRECGSISNLSVVSLNKRGRWDLVPFLMRLLNQLRSVNPDVLYSFLTIPNIAGGLASLFRRSLILIWGIRASELDFRKYDTPIVMSHTIQRILSRLPHSIIFNSTQSLKHHRLTGCFTGRSEVVPNGIQTEVFAPDSKGRQAVRAEWNISQKEIVVGIVARLDPQKGHEVFLKAASMALSSRRDIRFLVVGSGPVDYTALLRNLALSLGIENKIVWTGARHDLACIYSAMDLHCSASLTEAFSNTIAEAMSCQVPCIVTDVGESRMIVGETGLVIPPNDPRALCEGIHTMLRQDLSELGAQARLRIQSLFSADKMIESTDSILEGLVKLRGTEGLLTARPT